jgi:hypothetical protein
MPLAQLLIRGQQEFNSSSRLFHMDFANHEKP